MKAATYQIDEEGILDSTLNYLVKHGLENITIRELCKGTGIAQSSIYYRFSGKQDLICEVTEYGLREMQYTGLKAACVSFYIGSS